MNENENILDTIDQENGEIDINQHTASGTKRFLNFIIDYATLILFFGLLGGLLAISGNTDLAIFVANPVVSISFYILIPTLLESLTGKTLGKMITKTSVVNMSGERPTPLNLLGKNLARLIPFDAFSYFSKNAVGWHDSISNTRVIND